MSPGLESRDRSISSMFTEGWLGWLHRYTWDVKKKKQPGTFAISTMISNNFAPSHSHSFRKETCYIRHVLLVMVGKFSTCWWGWSFIPLFTSGSTTHIAIFSFRVHKAPISTHNRNAFFESSFSSPIFFSKPNICVLSSFFLSANLVAPRNRIALPPMHGKPLGSPRRQIQIPSGQALHDPGLSLANWRQEALPNLGNSQESHLWESRKIIDSKLSFFKSLFVVFFEPTNMGHSITNPKQHTIFPWKYPKITRDYGGTPPLWIPWKSTQNDPLQMGFCFPL